MNIKAGSSVYAPFKRLADIAAAVAGLLIALPVLAITMVGLSIVNGGQVWFLQPRPGRNERIFRIIKFKTMTDEVDEAGRLLPDEKRLTSFGRLVRKLSIDELPQLINVLKGDMSIVGPRPLLVSYLPLYDEEQRKRHLVRPGITGWAQVNGRNTVDWKERFAYDVWYVTHQSFMLDLKILILTVYSVLRMEGISSKTSATMEPFRGNG